MESVRGINTFIRIVQTGNFSRAARELGITPQAASIHVKLIEDWVGVRLLNRSTRKISLTEEGASFYRTCVDAFRSIDDEVERMRDASEEVFGTVKVAAPVGMASRFIAPALGRFLEKYPRVSVDLIVQNRIPRCRRRRHRRRRASAPTAGYHLDSTTRGGFAICPMRVAGLPSALR